VEKIKRHILCSITFSPEIRVAYEIMWGKYGRDGETTWDNVMRRMRIACWMFKATGTLRICNTYCFSTVTIVTQTRPNITCVLALSVL